MSKKAAIAPKKKHEFMYRVVSPGGKVAVGSLMSIHRKSAKRFLEFRYRGFKIVELEPKLVGSQGCIRIGKNAKGFGGMVWE